MAAYQKKATCLKAFLVFVDESGMLMAPLVRRTWAPRGHTPVLYQRTRSHKKVSVIAALCVAPERNRIQLYFRLHPDANINSTSVSGFLKNLSKQLNGPLILIWDRFLGHRAKKVQIFIRNNSKLHSFFLPPYAPELNPVENVWGYMKMNPLANKAHEDIESLVGNTRHSGRSLQRKQTLLRSFMNHTPLFLRLK
jgi:transposase